MMIAISACEHKKYGDCPICNHAILKEVKRMEKMVKSKKFQEQFKKQFEAYNEYVDKKRFLGYSKKRGKYLLKTWKKKKFIHPFTKCSRCKRLYCHHFNLDKIYKFKHRFLAEKEK